MLADESRLDYGDGDIGPDDGDEVGVDVAASGRITTSTTQSHLVPAYTHPVIVVLGSR